MIRTYWKPILIGLAAGLVGTALVLLAVHLWQDHQNLHALVNMVSAQAQQATKAAPK